MTDSGTESGTGSGLSEHFRSALLALGAATLVALACTSVLLAGQAAAEVIAAGCDLLPVARPCAG